MSRKKLHNLGIATALALLFTTSSPAMAGQCSYQGSWISSPDWLSTIAGQSQDSGTFVLDFPGFDSTLGGTFSSAVKHSVVRGSWDRRSGNTVHWVGIFYAEDEAGQTVWIGKLRGFSKVQRDCVSEYITNTYLDVFPSTANPLSDTPTATVPFPDHYGYRIR